MPFFKGRGFSKLSVNSVIEDSLSSANDRFLRVIGNGSQGITETVLLRHRQCRILFNCGPAHPSFKGIAHDVFVTHLGWSKIGGILPLIINTSNFSKRDQKKEMSVCCPPGLDILINSAQRFASPPDFKINLLHCDSVSKNSFGKFNINVIPIRNEQTTHYKPLLSEQASHHKYSSSITLSGMLSDKIDMDVSYSYVCRNETRKDWILSECLKRGIQPGGNMEKLWNGECVVNESGSVVNPEDVIQTGIWPSVIVIDCPTRGYLNNLLAKEEYAEFYRNEKLIIVHFTPVNVMQDERYIFWMRQFSQQTQHVIVNESNKWIPLSKTFKRQEVCRMISPKFFPKLWMPSDLIDQNSTANLPQFIDSILEKKCNESVLEPPPSERWLQKWKQVSTDLKLVQSWPGTTINLEDQSITRHSEPMIIEDKTPLDEDHLIPTPLYCPENPRITFLGTGSTICSPHRSTSAILLQMSSDKSMLLDCGEGTMHQIASLYDEAGVQELLTSIRLIYISHTHADHHLGLIGVLKAIKYAWEKSAKPTKNLLLILPEPLISWFENYSERFENIADDIILLSSIDLFSSNVLTKKRYCNLFSKMLGMKDIKLCWAKHNTFSYCVTLEHMCGWKISYSGDSQYNSDFVKIGLNSDLLIHEATYASGLDRMAKLTKHSTTDDAIRVGKEMNAKQVILTHFSQKYPVVPILKDLKNSLNVSVAFDFLQVNLNDIGFLPKLNEAYGMLFRHHINKLEELHDRLVKRELQLRQCDVSSEE